MGTEPETYPPAKHVMRDLDITTLIVSEQRSVGLIPIDDALRTRGAAALGLLSIVADTQAALAALIAAQPDWIATADLTLTELHPVASPAAFVAATLLRKGSKIVVVTVDVFEAAADADIERLAHDGAGPRASTGVVSFARIPASASRASGNLRPAERIGVVSPTSPGEPEHRPLLERIGLGVVDAAAGVVEVARTPYVGNSFGAVNGGVLGMIFQGAAEAAHPGWRAVDLQIHYLSQSKDGPVRTRLTPLRRDTDHAVCTIEAIDAGHRDQLLAVATVGLRG